MCGFLGGDDTPEPVKLPPPPPREEMMDVIDHLSGVQSIVVTGADGKKRREIQRLPRTPQEEAFFKQGEELISKSLKNIKELYQYRPQDVVSFQPLIDTIANLSAERQNDLAHIADFGDIAQQVADYKQMNSTLLEEELMRRERATEEGFAHRGISDSTAATEYRTSMARNADLARMQNNVNADIYGQDLAAKRLATNAAAFGLREQGRQGQLQGAETGYNLAQQQQQDLEARRKAAIAENMNLFGVGAGLRGEDQNKAIMSRAPELANSTFAMMNSDSLNRYNADVGRQNMNYQNELAAYNARPQSFGDKMLGLAGTVGGAMFGSPANTVAGSLGHKMMGITPQPNTFFGGNFSKGLVY